MPREAVQDDGGHRYVFVVKGNHLRRQEVQVGIANLTRIEIVSGLAAGDTIGVQSYSPTPMTDGVEVRIVENPS